MIRVAHVLHSLGMGGMEKGIGTVVSHASDGFAHEVICLTTSGAASALLPKGTPVHEMKLPPGNSLRSVARIARRLKEISPDVVHTRNWGGMDAAAAARWAGLRVVHGEHGWDAGDPDGSSRKRRLLRRTLQRCVREYTCVSRHIERWLRDDVGIRRPITQIYNGVDTERFRPDRGSSLREELRAEHGWTPDTFVTGIVARLDPIKDHETLFAAVRQLRDEGVDCACLVVGEGPRGEALRAAAGPEIHLVGHRSDVADVMGALDAFVLPSRNEGISNTILEAMASGLPVIASRVGGTPELIDDGVDGSLFEAGDTDALASALRAFARDRERREAVGAAARRRALDRYSIAAMVGAYESVWRRVSGAAQ